MTTTKNPDQAKVESKGRAYAQAKSWASFDKNNRAHLNILSLCRQAQWTKPHERYGEVADLNRLQSFLKSDKSPVKKPLMEMSKQEVSKIITALEGIVKAKYR